MATAAKWSSWRMCWMFTGPNTSASSSGSTAAGRSWRRLLSAGRTLTCWARSGLCASTRSARSSWWMPSKQQRSPARQPPTSSWAPATRPRAARRTTCSWLMTLHPFALDASRALRWTNITCCMWQLVEPRWHWLSTLTWSSCCSAAATGHCCCRWAMHSLHSTMRAWRYTAAAATRPSAEMMQTPRQMLTCQHLYRCPLQ